MKRKWSFPSKSKYHNVPTKVDGYRFDSKTEAAYYSTIKLLKDVGEILYIDVHPVFRLHGGVKYEADFTVYYKDNTIDVIDIKGFETPDFKIKRKLFDTEHILAPLKVLKKNGKNWEEI